MAATVVHDDYGGGVNGGGRGVVEVNGGGVNGGRGGLQWRCE